MNDELLVTYLTDHLAGSVVAIEIGEHLRDNHDDIEAKNFLVRLLAEIEADRDVLKDLIAAFGGGEGTFKKSAAWIAEKFSRLKVGASDSELPGLGRVEQFETLLLGIRGKLALWELLERLTPFDARLDRTDWRRLRTRAVRQGAEVERFRLEAARAAFLGPSLD